MSDENGLYDISDVEMEAELNVLGSFMFDPELLSRFHPNERWFGLPFHRRLFSVMQGLWREGDIPHPLALAERMSEDPEWDIFGLEQLAGMVDQCAPQAVEDCLRLLLSAAIRREGFRIASRVLH